MDVTFGPGSILYKETIAVPIEGVGHFEPLRHYAETHVLLEPLPQGAGMAYATVCSEDVLDRNWQRLIMQHFQEREHLGVLTGSPITDMRITLLTGRAHLKHTEGGDFRQATYRAIRQGLMEAKKKGDCRLLEPWYGFRLEVPQDMVGHAMADIQRMSGTFDTPTGDGEYMVLNGTAPVSEMRDYAMDVNAYTHGRGHLSCVFAGYQPCHNADEVIENMAYDPGIRPGEHAGFGVLRAWRRLSGQMVQGARIHASRLHVGWHARIEPKDRRVGSADCFPPEACCRIPTNG